MESADGAGLVDAAQEDGRRDPDARAGDDDADEHAGAALARRHRRPRNRRTCRGGFAGGKRERSQKGCWLFHERDVFSIRKE